MFFLKGAKSMSDDSVWAIGKRHDQETRFRPVSLVQKIAILFCAISVLSACVPEAIATEADHENPPQEPMALARPMSPIVVDGDLDDWPDGMERFAISSVLEKGPQGAVVDKAEFQIGYSSDARSIYMIIRVHDDEHVEDSAANGLSDEQDQLLLYLDKAHDPKGSGAIVLGMNALYQEFDDTSTSWDPNARQPDGEDIQAAVRRHDDQTIYEIALSFDDAVEAGNAIGLDFMIYDADSPEPQDSVARASWRDTDGKINVPFKLGHVFLVGESARTGSVNGQLVWAEEDIGGPINMIRVASTEHDQSWVRQPVGEDGRYRLNLPEGTYRVTPEWGIYNGGDIKHKVIDEGVEIVVSPESQITAPDLAVRVAEPLDMLPAQGILLKQEADRYAQIDAFIDAHMRHFDIPGASLAIIENGALTYHRTYGVSNTFSGDAVTGDTIFEAASITKPVFAFAVLRLAERGVIDLDRPLHTYLPFDEIADDDRSKLMTARHVLSHQTGLPNWRSGKLEMLSAPGTGFGYSGEGFQYLQRVVEHVTGRDMADILEEEVLQPLRLENTYFAKSDRLFGLVAHGHDDHYPHKVSLPNKTGAAWSMHTEAKSFSRFAEALMAREGLKPATYADMLKRHTVTDKYETVGGDDWKSYFGLGIHMEDTPFGLAIGHGGNNGDFKCEMKLYTDLGVGFILFTNGNTGDQLAGAALEQFLITGDVDVM